MLGFYKTILVCSVVFCVGSLAEERDVKQQYGLSKLVRNWAEKLGGELWHFGEVVTRRNMVIDSYKHTTVEKIDGQALLLDIHEKISTMLAKKVEAIKRIMEVAENSATQKVNASANYTFYNAKDVEMFVQNCTGSDQEESEQNDGSPEAQEYRGYKSFENYQQDEVKQEEIEVEEKTKTEDVKVSDGSETPLASQKPPPDKGKLPLICNRRFYNIPVNTNYSAVHVPSNVYERSDDVINGIYWSEELDQTFRNNYKVDPTLSWQYFGSSTGFMRQYPAMIWSQEPIDLFDCRTRSWYIEAASSPKDIVILVDRSGSMTGMRREIARHVVHNILDTLGNNDYINIFTFSNTTDALVDCFNDILVQANLANVRLLKESMSNFKTEQIANFSLALTTAFELLEKYRLQKKGAQCNQAIMLITDGVQYNYKEIFERYNWQNLPFMNVRVFTYLIGREVSDVREVKWMACANQGYYVHLSTYAEVREEVLQYIPVMARPMVLNPSRKPHPTWSPVYADVTDPKLTNWLWRNRQRNKQKEVFLLYKRNRTYFVSDEQDRKYVHQQSLMQDNSGELQSYRLMTSVSLPVYDLRENANITENIQINEAIWISVTRETRVANLLGVAGTDIPIENIQILTQPYRLGVNGYAFIVTNNGYILLHPDLRPVFQGILKPAYNRVDVTEVEIMDDDSEPREFGNDIRELRRRVVMQEKGNATLKVKTHLDDMRRITLSKRHYFHMGVANTPFSLVIALPHRYGFSRVQHPVEDDIHRLRSNDKIKDPFEHFFTGNWTIHPEWQYCRHLGDKLFFDTPEEELLHFLKKIEAPGWRWGKECDRKLVVKVVADAKITSWFNQNITIKDDNGAEFLKRFGLTVVFMATDSGLTRWKDFAENVEKDDKERENDPLHFHLLYNRAVDEVWYKRAVEQHYVDPMSFVYSVPFDVGTEKYSLVTASHAIFREDSNRKAPAAVVGFQFYHDALQAWFKKITTTCGGESTCLRTCDSMELYCLVLDDNGYVIVSDEKEDTGRFFGEIRSDIMYQLVSDGIYKPNRMYDYQGTCFQPLNAGNPASTIFTPLSHLMELTYWSLGTLTYLVKSVWGDDVLYHDSEDAEEVTPTDQSFAYASEKEVDQRLLIQKTRPDPCDQEMFLYNLVHYTERNISSSAYNKTMMGDCKRPYIVQPVVGSNMILIVISTLCREEEHEPLKTPTPEEISYNMSLACFRVLNNNFTRRLYMDCINRHINESQIKLCGGGSRLASLSYSMLLSILLLCKFV